MTSFPKAIHLLFLLLALPTGLCVAGEPPESDAISITADFTFQGGAQDSIETSRALALFGAKYKAVHLAAKYLTHKGMLDHYQNMQNEIFCLATDEIKVSLLEDRFDAAQNDYYVKIRADITIVDFIRAHLKDLEAEKEEAHFPYSREMEQPVMQVIDPGRELSRAYRYMRQKQWRIAIIYMDHLERKYPSWGELYLAKALALFGINDHDNMVNALKRACTLGNAEACHELPSFTSETP